MATLAAARQMRRGRADRRFQPHRFTRPKRCSDEFTRAFGDADAGAQRYLSGVGDADSGVHSAALWVAIKEGAYAGNIAQPRGTIEFLLANAARDTVLTLGAGSAYKIGEAFLARLKGTKNP